jgi:hypothetical protein
VVEDDEVAALRILASARKLRASFVKTPYLDVGLTVGYKYAQSVFNQ